MVSSCCHAFSHSNLAIREGSDSNHMKTCEFLDIYLSSSDNVILNSNYIKKHIFFPNKGI